MQPTNKHVQDVKRQLSARFLSQPGVSGVGVEQDEDGQPLIVIHVSTLDPALRDQIPDQLDGVPIQIVESGPFQPF